jgi:3-methyladenine DNA glycosylase AlkD
VTHQEAIKELELLRNDRGIEYYKKTFGDNGHYLGLGLTQLRKIAKKIKTDVNIAEKLIKSKYFEAKMLSLMIDDPQRYDKKKLEALLKNLPAQYSESPLSYFIMVFTEYIVAKSPDVQDLIHKWIKSKDSVKRFIAYSSLNNLAKSKNIDNNYFNQFLPVIERNIQKEANNVKDAMNNSLLSWGQRNKVLHSKILKSLKKIGKVTVDYGETSCQTPDVQKILTSERIIKKFS